MDVRDLVPGEVRVVELNPRVSRSSASASKATRQERVAAEPAEV